MTKDERLHQRKILNEALEESFKKMIELKKKLGHSIVTADNSGKTIVVSAEEAEKMAYRK